MRDYAAVLLAEVTRAARSASSPSNDSLLEQFRQLIQDEPTRPVVSTRYWLVPRMMLECAQYWSYHGIKPRFTSEYANEAICVILECNEKDLIEFQMKYNQISYAQARARVTYSWQIKDEDKTSG